MISPVFASTKAVRAVMNDVLKSFHTCSGHSYTEQTSGKYSTRRSIFMFVPWDHQTEILRDVQKQFDTLGYTNVVKTGAGYLRCNAFLL